MGRMIRVILGLVALAALAACSDGRGSQYSSARADANQGQPSYIPVTPGATPIDQRKNPVVLQPVVTQTAEQQQVVVQTSPSAIGTQPAATPAQTAAAPGAPAPAAAPVVFADIPTGQAPISSLKPLARGEVPVQVASAAPVVPQSAVSRARPATPRPTRAAAITPRSGAKFAKGPIYSACLNAGRKAATQSRCGCVQWVADQELTAAQQRRGAGYFRNQQGLQDTRQSDNPASEAFWKAWKAYGQSASRQCKSS